MKLKQKIADGLNKKFGKYKWYNSFKEDYGFRVLALMLGGIIINVLYAIINSVSGLVYSSLWYGVFAGYYVVLAMQRIGVLISYRAAKKKYGGNEKKLESEKWKIYLVNGAILVPLDIALGAIITVMFLRQKPTVSGEIMAITSAAYTTYKIVMAIRNILKAKRLDDAIIKTVRCIAMVDALASLIILSMTLITTFGSFEAEEMRTMLAIVGFAVCAFTIGIGSYMIIKGAKALNLDKRTNEYGQKI